ncbi:MAG: caspase family protein [Burkholderiales bacterium]|nr:caspase family protein [Burkholderiales bacterium]
MQSFEFVLSRRGMLSASLAGLAPSVLAQASSGGAAVPRVALVVGNGSYPQAPLRNAVSDAQSVARVLAEQGFAVTTLADARRAELEAAIARTGESLRGRNGVGLLYFAGHGLQLDWRNYILPVDARIEKADDVPTQCIDVQQVLAAFKAASTRMNIVVLDACRDNPFAERASGRGLAQMDAPAGTFLAYATAPGNVAEDGTATSGNGPYALHLVQELKRPDARIEDVFKRVRFAVRRLTQGRQVPWESTSLDEDFSFGRGIVEPVSATAPGRDEAFASELAAWQSVLASGTAADIYGYLARYPNGLFAELARLRLDQLERPAVRPLPAPGGAAAIDIAARRYEMGDVIEWEFHDRVRGTTQRMAFRVTSLDGERVIFNRGSWILTQSSATVKNASGVKSPPVIQVVSDMAVGRRWRSAFTNTFQGVSYRNFYDSRVVALEDLATPMGTLRCFRVEHRGESTYPDGRVLLLARTDWVDAQRARVMRSDHEYRWSHPQTGAPTAMQSSGSSRVLREDPLPPRPR